MSLHVGHNGAVKAVKKCFAGVNSGVKKVKAIYGGINGLVKLLWKYEPKVFEGTQLSKGMAQMASASDGNGNVLFLGGEDEERKYSNLVHRYSKTGTRTMLTNLSISRTGAAAADGSGNVVCGGGSINESSFGTDVVERYTVGGVKTILSPLISSRTGAAATSDGWDGCVWFFGGEREESTWGICKYSPSGVRTTESPAGRRGGVSACMDGIGRPVFGGGMVYGSWASYSDDVIVYLPNGTQTTLELSQARSGLRSATDGKGAVVFGGGYNGSNLYAVVEKFSTSNVRTIMVSMSENKERHTAAADGSGHVLMAAGYTGNDRQSRKVFCYSPDGSVTSLPNLTTGSEYVSSGTAGNGTVIFAGGIQGWGSIPYHSDVVNCYEEQ